MARLLIFAIIFALTNGVHLPIAVEPSREHKAKIPNAKWEIIR